jgi:hypothetical protein
MAICHAREKTYDLIIGSDGLAMNNSLFLVSPTVK